MTEAPLVVCPACNAEQGLENFRIFSTAPVRYYDFCSNCEQKHGVLTLYRTHYSLATPIVRDSVLGKTSIADVNIEKSAADRKTAAQKELARRELARRSLLYFTTQFHPTYKAGWVHNDIARRLERFLRQVEAGESPCLMIFVPPRHGKLLADSTPVLTANRGWTTHGDLRVGDQVFSPRGQPISVLAVSHPNFASLEVEMFDGEVIKAHPNHEWVVYDRQYKAWRTHETRSFVRQTKFGKQKEVAPSGRAMYQLPTVNALQRPDANLPMAPYMLGVWLGDGKSSGASFCFAERDRVILDAVVGLGYASSWDTVHAGTGVNYVGFKGAQQVLRRLGVLGCKHIPRSYMDGSIDQRLELLAGLIDTDGHVEPSTGRVRVVTCSNQLRDDIVELTRSLGWQPYCYTQPACTSTSGVVGKQNVHYVGFQPTFAIPTRVQRKRIERFAPQRLRGIKSVRTCAPEVGRCIQVDSPDGLYLVGKSLVPTHNSTLASDMFPSWALGHHPEWEVISCSYTAALPIKFSRSIRDRMKTAEYAKMFPHAKIRSDSQNVESWDTTSGGSYTAAGVGGSITGKGAHILITDDPIKDYEEASSEKIRTGVFDWYNTTAKSRMAPGGGKLIIQTRWHDLDLAGAMLQGMEEAIKAEIPEGEYDDWEVVSYPAIAEHDEFLTRGGKILLGSAPPDARVLRRAGDALHPDRYTIKALKRQRNSMPAQQWNALYQQNPVPDDGDFFSKSDFRYFDKLADDIKHYRVLIAVDPSFGKDADNHWTVFVVGALDSNDDLYVIDMVRARMHSLEFADTLIALCNKYNPYQVGIERGAYEKAVRPIIDVKTSMNRIYIPFTDKLVPIQEKTVRAKPLQARLQMGKLHLLNQPWAVSAVQEMLRFPNGVYDDVVDAMAWLSRLALLVSPPRKYAKAKRKIKSWQDTLKAQGNGSNKSFMAA